MSPRYISSGDRERYRIAASLPLTHQLLDHADYMDEYCADLEERDGAQALVRDLAEALRKYMDATYNVGGVDAAKAWIMAEAALARTEKP